MQYGFEIVLHQAGEAEIRLFTPPTRELGSPPLVHLASDSATGRAVVFMGQLYYHDDLQARFPQIPKLASMSDAAVVLAVFQAYGTQGLQFLEGDFALALVDVPARRLLALRDPMGAWPLFYMMDRDTVRVGTSLRSLAAQASTIQVNLDFIATFLMFPLPTPELPTTQTALVSGQRVLPGTLIALDCHGHSETVWQHTWLEHVSETTGISCAEAAAEVHALFTEAVWQRIARGKIAAHLSGGMDSSSIVCVARDFFVEKRVPDVLTTLSVVYNTPGLADERRYIQMVIAQGGPIDPLVISGDEALDFEWFRQNLPQHDEPYLGLYRFAFEKRVIDTAYRAGATVMLTGIGGDVIFEGNRLHGADLLRQGYVRAALADARRWAQASNSSLWSIFYRQCLEPTLPGMLRGGLGTLLRRGYGQWPHIALTAIPPWVRRDFARTHHMWHKAIALAHHHSHFPVEHSYNRYSLEMSAGDWASWYIGGTLGIHTAHPFHDLRLIHYVMGLPRRLREVPHRPKAVLQEAMRGLLPEPIRMRRVKCHFNDLYGNGLLRNLSQLETLIRRSRLDDMGIFDTQQLCHALHQAAMGIGDFKAFGRLSTSLALLAWLRQLEEPESQRAPSAIYRLGNAPISHTDRLTSAIFA